jgi:hypothetical protein
MTPADQLARIEQDAIALHEAIERIEVSPKLASPLGGSRVP